MLERILGERTPRVQTLLLLLGVRSIAVTVICWITAQIMVREQHAIEYAIAFLLCAIVSLTSQVLIFAHTAQELETRTARLRLQLVRAIRELQLDAFQAVNPSTLLAKLAKATSDQSTVALELIAVFMETCYNIGLLFLAFLVSPWAFLLLAALMLLMAVLTWLLATPLRAAEHRQREAGEALFRALSNQLDAAKELRLSAARNRAFMQAEALPAIRNAVRARVGAQVSQSVLAILIILLELSFPALLAFGFPNIGEHGPMSAALLMVLGTNLSFLPARRALIVASAGDAQATLQETIAQLRAAPTLPFAAPEVEAGLARFQRLSFAEVRYDYPAAPGVPGFGIGPLSFELERGRICFLTGGNGAGKSTLLSILTGLRPAGQGSIALDGRPVGQAELASLVTPLFPDPHLFDRLYGYESVDPARVRDWLARLGLAGKTDYRGGRFTRLDLSSGQRKRLALICALSEQRPILVCDEWAAEQDPGSRAWFYRELLPALKRKGRLVIAVSHDDRYLDAADQLLVMRDGRLEAAKVTA